MADANLVETEFLTREEAADYLRTKWKQRVSAATLSVYATLGKGPPYQITETRSGTFYKKSDVDAWAAGRLIPGKVYHHRRMRQAKA